MVLPFKKAKHSFILSDLHLTIAEPERKKRPLWKKFNRKDYFSDEHVANLIQKATQNIKKDIELILAGDIFDFDSVMAFPENPNFKISWLEKKRGLNSEEEKSLFKIEKIIEHHPVFFQALYQFVQEGHDLIFIIGNHDLELHWKTVQERVLEAIGITDQNKKHVRFCHWFYISNNDTLVEHGNQYDPYCSILNPVTPFFKRPSKAFIRLPFGNLTHRYMINGMGVFNPHVDKTFLLSFTGYLKFYLNTMRTQPFLIVDWLFGAMATCLISIRDNLMPRIKNPLTIEDQYQDIAKNANAEPSMVRALRELHAHPVAWNVFKIMRVLWLDRALLFLILLYLSFQIVTLLHLVWNVSFSWMYIILPLLIPLFFLYVHNFEPIKPITKISISNEIITLATKITKVNRLICGHTHAPKHKKIDGIEYLNAGYWSPSFKDPDCSIFERNKSFVWLKPDVKKRTAHLLYWEDIADINNPFA
ncbi:MAG: hypothetical protein ABII18_04200 [bacterium]|nr:metallophosphoesterase [bacterium]MBU1918086.1 metallophosphoesterase [bacterium]